MWAEQTGKPLEVGFLDWDPNTAQFFQAIMEVLASGAQVFLRPGSGGRSIGIAIWEGDDRHPATWFYEWEELDQWTAGVVAKGEAMRARKSGQNGA
jgi:hypothetical protein